MKTKGFSRRSIFTPPSKLQCFVCRCQRGWICVLACTCAEIKIQCCLHMWTPITKIHSVFVIGKFYLLRNGPHPKCWTAHLRRSSEVCYTAWFSLLSVSPSPSPPKTNIKKYPNEESAFSVIMLYILRFTLSVPQHLAEVLPNFGQFLISVWTSQCVSLTLVTFWLTRVKEFTQNAHFNYLPALAWIGIDLSSWSLSSFPMCLQRITC